MPVETTTGPESSSGFGPRENADQTRQSQHTFSNDTPTDVNHNAIAARSQSLTVDVLGKGFVAAQERRQIIADDMVRKP